MIERVADEYRVDDVLRVLGRERPVATASGRRRLTRRRLLSCVSVMTWRTPSTSATIGDAYEGPSPVHVHFTSPVFASNAVSAPLIVAADVHDHESLGRRAVTSTFRRVAASAPPVFCQQLLAAGGIECGDDAAHAHRVKTAIGKCRRRLRTRPVCFRSRIHSSPAPAYRVCQMALPVPASSACITSFAPCRVNT